MKEFFDQVWLGNTVRSYVVVSSVILFVILVKRYLATSVAALIFQLVKSIWKDVDRKTFTRLVAKPLGFFLVILFTLATLHKLNFPEVINVTIFNISLKEILHTVGTLVLIISFVRLLLKMIDFIAIILHLRSGGAQDVGDNQLIVFFKDFFKVIVVVIGFLMVLKFAFGFNIGNLLTGLSIVGAAIALALRESLENLIASFIIFFDKPFSTGDVVKVHNFTGTVEKIGLRSTRIRTDQKTYITVPNKQMVDSILDNISLRNQRRADLRLELGLSAPSDVLDGFVAGVRKILQDKKEVENFNAVLSDITNSAYILTVDYYTGPITQQEFNAVREDINFSILRLLEEMKLDISGASTDIKIIQPSAAIAQ